MQTRLFCSILVLLLAGPSVSGVDATREVTSIDWKTLAPDGGQYNDAFARLSQAQRQNLAFVVRIRRLIAEEKLAADGADAAEVAGIASELEQNGVEIDWLLGQREVVSKQRGRHDRAIARSVAKKLKGQPILLSGYVIPLMEHDGRVTEFFLVSTVAACSHASAPPENQMVYVQSPDGIIVRKRGTAAKVMGQLTSKLTHRTLVGTSGPQRYAAGYQMLATDVVTAAGVGRLNSHRTSDKAVAP